MSMPRDTTSSMSRTLAGMAALVLLALVLRLWGITHESAWWDEYSSLMHLERGSLFEFLRYNRTLDPATLPLYYSLEYFWSRIAGTDTLWMRVPSLLMGLALVPLLFALGRRCFNPAAGWVAAACVAISPIHVFHAQGIRMYALLTLLAALSMYSWLRLREGDSRRWWVAHGLIQFLLSWTHPFALLIPLVQGIAWLPRAVRGELRAFLGWCAITALAWLPVLVYLGSVEYWPEDSTASWFPAPSFMGVLADLFADDVVAATYQLRISPDALAWLPVLGPILLSARPLFDAALLLGFAGAGIAATLLWLRGGAGAPARAWGGVPVLLLWLVLPVLVLYLGSLLFRPMIFPRYTVHCSLALYLLAGAGIGAIPRAAERMAAALLLLALLGYQLLLVHPGPQRANYAGVARAIAAEANSTADVVVVRGELWRDVFEHNARGLALPILSAETDALCVLAASHYLGGAPAGARVWLVAPDDYFDDLPEAQLDAALGAASLQYTATRFFGIRDIYLYKVEGAGSREASPGLVKLARDKGDSEQKRALCRALAGGAAALAARGAAPEATRLLVDYFGEGVAQDFLYGALADAVATRPAEALDAFDTAMEVTEALGLQQQGHAAMGLDTLLHIAAGPHAPAIVSTTLLEAAAGLSGEDAEHCIRAAFAVAHPPQNLHFIAIQAATRHAESAAMYIKVLLDAPNPPHDLYFMLIEASAQYPNLAEAFVAAALAVPNPPDNLYFHLMQSAVATARSQGCGPVLTRLLTAARPLSPLDFELNWSVLERRCAAGKELLSFLDAKARLDEGMDAFGEGRLEEAWGILSTVRIDDYGMPSLMRGVLSLMKGIRSGFDTSVQESLTDPGVDKVFGPVFRAILAGDRAGAIRAAEALRGTDIDSTDTLLGVIDTALPATP